MQLRSLCLPKPKKAGAQQFKTLIQVRSNSQFYWPVILPLPIGSQIQTVETALLSHVLAGRIVTQLTGELIAVLQKSLQDGADIRRAHSHAQQIAMYICHVVLRLSLSDIGEAFGKHRTTVSYACRSVEDRRDNAAYDQFVSTVERLVLTIFNPGEGEIHD